MLMACLPHLLPLLLLLLLLQACHDKSRLDALQQRRQD
jgi:hypothetical protein